MDPAVSLIGSAKYPPPFERKTETEKKNERLPLHLFFAFHGLKHEILRESHGYLFTEIFMKF